MFNYLINIEATDQRRVPCMVYSHSHITYSLGCSHKNINTFTPVEIKRKVISNTFNYNINSKIFRVMGYGAQARFIN